MAAETHHQHLGAADLAEECLVVEGAVAHIAERAERRLGFVCHVQRLGDDDLHAWDYSVAARPLSISALAISMSPGPSILIERSHGIS